MFYIRFMYFNECVIKVTFFVGYAMIGQRRVTMSIYQFEVKDVTGNIVSMEAYKDKVLLIVNTASHCGFTPQYEGLSLLYDTYHEQGFEVLDFPCNQFGMQAPESSEELASFCQLNYHTNFTTFAKLSVNGEHADPLFVYLKDHTKSLVGKAIKWNFTKFLVDRKGNVIKRYAPQTKPEAIKKDIEALL